MKKTGNIILLVSGVLIVIGLAMRLHSDGVSAENRVKSERSCVCPEARKLLEVGMNGSVPSQIKEYEGFVVSFNKDTHNPNWVAWELLGCETDGAEKRRNQFYTDGEVIGCAYTQDYTRSGYDRGHMCPAADQKWSQRAMDDCFYLTNICPQDHALNAGAWSTLEKKERIWAQRDSAIIIVAGPIYEGNQQPTIGESGVRVPSAFFKVMLAPYLSRPRAIGFIYPNMTSPGNMQNYAMPVREVEKKTGLDFFKALPDDMEEQVETTTSFNEWNRN